MLPSTLLWEPELQRYRQTVDELIASLSPIEASWKDEHAETVTSVIASIPEKSAYSRADIVPILEPDFDAGLTAIRLLLDMSKDELGIALRETLGTGGIGVKRFRADKHAYIAALEQLGVITSLQNLVSTPVSWRDILVERLKSGRGSAIKGQARGRFLEDFTEELIKSVFLDIGYRTRCRFIGAGGESTEKADFAIPSREDPGILIEVKAYGATGSKQTDVLGDIARIVKEKREDTHLLLVTDGETWKTRRNDLRKLVDMQNQGLIARIYTQKMADELLGDLRQLRQDHAL